MIDPLLDLAERQPSAVKHTMAHPFYIALVAHLKQVIDNLMEAIAASDVATEEGRWRCHKFQHRRKGLIDLYNFLEAIRKQVFEIKETEMEEEVIEDGD